MRTTINFDIELKEKFKAIAKALLEHFKSEFEPKKLDQTATNNLI